MDVCEYTRQNIERQLEESITCARIELENSCGNCWNYARVNSLDVGKVKKEDTSLHYSILEKRQLMWCTIAQSHISDASSYTIASNIIYGDCAHGAQGLNRVCSNLNTGFSINTASGLVMADFIVSVEGRNETAGWKTFLTGKRDGRVGERGRAARATKERKRAGERIMIQPRKREEESRAEPETKSL